MASATDLPLSLLDLAVVGDGGTSGQALADTTTLCQLGDELGFKRFWVAEHHNMDTVASTNPPVLIAHLAASTDNIWVGSGGVMLPNHPSLVVAEQFALLEAMHPGRIDVGIGRAPGTDQQTAAALRRTPHGLGAEDFPHHLIDLMGLLGDQRTTEGMWQHFRATPNASSYPRVVLLGSSDYSARLAGMLGLPFGFANHFDMGGTLEAVEMYRDSFQPSAILDEPYTIVTAQALAADTREKAVWLGGPGQLRKLGMRTGRSISLMTPEDAADHPLIETANAMPSTRIIGTAPEVVVGLTELADETGANELMISTTTHGLAERLSSTRAIADAWNLSSLRPQPEEATRVAV